MSHSVSHSDAVGPARGPADTPSTSTLPVGVFVAIMIAAFMIGVSVKVAVANHYHSTNGMNHGLVFGSSTTDGAWHSRVEAGGGSTFRSCDAHEDILGGRYLGGASVGGTTATCNYFVGSDRAVREIDGVAVVRANTMSEHAHRAADH